MGWTPVLRAPVDELSDEYRPIALGFGGHGRPEKIEGSHTVRQYDRDADSFLDVRDLDDVVLVG